VHGINGQLFYEFPTKSFHFVLCPIIPNLVSSFNAEIVMEQAVYILGVIAGLSFVIGLFF